MSPTEDIWALAYSRGRVEPSSVEGANWLEPPAGRFYADPFLFEHRGEPWVFLEEYDLNTGRGHISASPLLNFHPLPVLQKPWHLSYPFLVEHGGELFCIPEQHEKGEVALYKCLRFPDRWMVESVLIEGFAGVDPTLIFHEGLWWMWVGDQEGNARSEVHLYSSKKLTGPWARHRLSPAVCRPMLARPAGQPWFDSGSWYRPVQNRTRTYGGSMKVYRVEELTCENYREVEVDSWEPRETWPYADGLHHICRLGD